MVIFATFECMLNLVEQDVDSEKKKGQSDWTIQREEVSREKKKKKIEKKMKVFAYISPGHYKGTIRLRN